MSVDERGATCELCWATFPDDDELAKHVEMEESILWPIDGLTIVGGERPGCANPSGRSRRPTSRPFDEGRHHV